MKLSVCKAAALLASGSAMRKKLTVWACLALALVWCSSASALTIDAIDSGWYNSLGAHDPVNDNYIVGQAFIGGQDPLLRNFFAFDLSSVPGTVNSATFRVFLSIGGYAGDPTETFSLFDVTSDLDALLGGFGGVAAYNDLGTGVTFGSRSISLADEGFLIDISLNAAALASINAALGGQWAIGGAVTTVVGATNQYIFAFSDSGQSPSFTRQLILQTGPAQQAPEPPALALLGLALAGLAIARRGRGSTSRSASAAGTSPRFRAGRGLALGAAALCGVLLAPATSHATLLGTEVDAAISIIGGPISVGQQFVGPQTVGAGVEFSGSIYLTTTPSEFEAPLELDVGSEGFAIRFLPAAGISLFWGRNYRVDLTGLGGGGARTVTGIDLVSGGVLPNPNGVGVTAFGFTADSAFVELDSGGPAFPDTVFTLSFAAVPEPGSLALLGLGLAGLGTLARHRQARGQPRDLTAKGE